MGVFMKWERGYLQVELKGSAPERFLNLCRTRNIYIWDITCEERNYQFCVGIDDYFNLKPIIRKTKTRPVIKRRYGFPFLAAHWKKRKGFLLGIILFFGLIFLLSQLIWSIEITGQYTHTKEEMTKYLNQNGIHVGMPVRDVGCTKLEENIRKAYSDIGWVSAQIEGTRLIIQIKETNMPVLYEQRTIPSHMIADKDGYVSSIVTRKGTPMVKAGDKVKAGDILISGVVDIVGDNDLLLRKDAVVADGDIMLETKYQYKDTKNLEYIGKDFTGSCKRRFYIEAFQKRFELIWPLNFWNSYEFYDKIVENHSVFFLNIGIICEREYTPADKIYSDSQAKAYLEKKFHAYTKKIIEKGVIIKQNNVKIKKAGKKMTAAGTLLVEEPVAAYRKILDSEWRNTQEDEHSGEDN